MYRKAIRQPIEHQRASRVQNYVYFLIKDNFSGKKALLRESLTIVAPLCGSTVYKLGRQPSSPMENASKTSEGDVLKKH